VTREAANIEGSTSLQTPTTTVTVPGGVLAVASNSGRNARNEFAAVPEVGVNLGWQLRPWLRANIGFTFLYWSNVLRPGDQIDRTINFAQVPSDPTFGLPGGPRRPAFTFNETDFW